MVNKDARQEQRRYSSSYIKL